MPRYVDPDSIEGQFQEMEMHPEDVALIEHVFDIPPQGLHRQGLDRGNRQCYSGIPNDPED